MNDISVIQGQVIFRDQVEIALSAGVTMYIDCMSMIWLMGIVTSSKGPRFRITIDMMYTQHLLNHRMNKTHQRSLCRLTVAYNLAYKCTIWSFFFQCRPPYICVHILLCLQSTSWTLQHNRQR